MTEQQKLIGILHGLKKDAIRMEDIQPQMNLREDLFFTSFEFLELVGLLEQEFGICFTSNDFNSANFQTVSTVETLIQSKLAVKTA